MKSGASYLFNTVEIVAQYNRGTASGDGSSGLGPGNRPEGGSRIPFGEKVEAIKQ